MPPQPRLKLRPRPSLPCTATRSAAPPLVLAPSRRFSSSPIRQSSSSPAPETIPPPPPQRWLSGLRARVGKCIIFGCNATQLSRAAKVLRVLADEWRPLTAGSDGFLTGGRRGLEGQKVVWGEQDSFVGASALSPAELARVPGRLKEKKAVPAQLRADLRQSRTNQLPKLH